MNKSHVPLSASYNAELPGMPEATAFIFCVVNKLDISEQNIYAWA